MTTLLAILVFLAGAILGAVVARLAAQSRQAILLERGAALEQALTAAKATIDGHISQIQSLAEARAALQATLDSERRSADEKLALLAQAGEQLKSEFRALAGSALESNNTNFLQLAKTTLERYQTQASGELEAREKAVETLVKPLADSLKQVDEQVRQLEKSRAEAYGTLTAQVASLVDTQKALQSETGNLVKALREPQARGRWGELQLRRVVELAGMLDYCDFEEQVTVTNDERRYRPDVVVKLPGGKNIVIDAKAPLTAYLAALEAGDDVTYRARLKDHAQQVRQHMDSLGGKNYWAQFQPSPEFVVLFLPGEVFFRAALDADPELIEYGVAQRVITASPTTLIALLKAVAYGWNQKNLTDSARQISEAGKQLYERLCTMTEHMQEMGKKLGGAVKAYNEMLSSMERRVFPLGRKFPDFDRALLPDWLPQMEQLEKTPRELEAPDWEDKGEPELPLLAKADRAKA